MEAEPKLTVTTSQGPLPNHRDEADPFDRLFLAEYGRVVAVANRILADRSEAEDVAQEVFIDFHGRHPATAPYAGPWLHSAAVHTALNRIRSRRRRELREQGAGIQQPESADPAEAALIADDRHRVRMALGRLADRQAAILALRYSGLSYAEVGTALGVGAGQIGTLLKRAEAALKKEITRGTSA